jgi:undecaprenyl-diphosphatase
MRFMGVLLFLKVVLLGLVEGATEFIPVSSTGHLILVSDWLGLSGSQIDTFHVFIQSGAILAIVWLYRQKIWQTATGAIGNPARRHFAINVIIATIPAVIVGALAHSFIKTHLFNPFTVAGALVVGGFIMLAIETWGPTVTVDDVDQISHRKAIGVGLAQVLALFPGTSRAGATIMGGYALGLSRTAATEFSFFLAIRLIIAASALDLYGSREYLSTADIPVFAVGFIVSFFAAVVVVKLFLVFLAKHTFVPFAWYRIVLGLILIAWYFPR